MDMRLIFLPCLLLLSHCKTTDQGSRTKADAAGCGTVTPQSLAKLETMLAKGHSTDDFIDFFNQEPGQKSAKLFEKEIEGINQEITNCLKSAPVKSSIEGIPSGKPCNIRVEKSSIVDQLKKGLWIAEYAPFSKYIKVKVKEGQPKLFVKRSGLLPEDDPVQERAGGVIAGFKNKFFWRFRKESGDLHPAFLWSHLTNTDIKKFVNRGYEALPDEDTFVKCEKLTEALEKAGFLTVDLGKNPSDWTRFSIVNPARAQELKNSEEVVTLIKQYFKTDEVESVKKSLTRLVDERLNPIIKIKNREITAENFASMNLEVPEVYLGWSMYFDAIPLPFARLKDHHRITGAYELGISPEVKLSKVHSFDPAGADNLKHANQLK